MSADWFGPVDTFLALGLSASLFCLFCGHMGVLWHYGRRFQPTSRTEWPPVSILKPIEGVDAETRDALGSFCRLQYPGTCEIIVGTLSEHDPVVAVVQEMQKTYPEARIRWICAPILGTNRKSSIMDALWREAQGTCLLFSDADVWVEPDYAQRLVDELLKPGVGCVTCLPRSVGVRSLGGKLIALHYGCNYLPQWMLARQTIGISWAIGHTMAVSREVLERLGGFGGFLNHLADDYELGRRTHRLGLEVVVAPVLVDCAMPDESIAFAVRRLQRWKRTIRRARGPASVGVVLTLPVVWATLWLIISPGSPLVWSLWTAVLALRWLGAWALQILVRMPDWHRIWWLLPLVDLLELWTLIGAYTGDHVWWRGQRYRLLPDGTLAR